MWPPRRCAATLSSKERTSTATSRCRSCSPRPGSRRPRRRSPSPRCSPRCAHVRADVSRVRGFGSERASSYHRRGRGPSEPRPKRPFFATSLFCSARALGAHLSASHPRRHRLDPLATVPRPAALVPAAALRSLARRPPPPQAMDGTKADRCALAVERPCPPLVNGKAAPPLPLNEWKQ